MSVAVVQSRYGCKLSMLVWAHVVMGACGYGWHIPEPCKDGSKGPERQRDPVVLGSRWQEKRGEEQVEPCVKAVVEAEVQAVADRVMKVRVMKVRVMKVRVMKARVLRL